jgi:predicted nucleotidyltransferase
MQPETLAAPAAAPILRRLKEELVRLYGSRLERAILFGSRARGEARPDSDWDVAVVLRGYWTDRDAWFPSLRGRTTSA